MKKIFKFMMVMAAAAAAFACGPKEPQYATRVEKILAELNNPESDYVLVISHRGDWRNYPENSIPAIESIIRMGVDMMELDVKMTKDSVLVLMHDKTVDRMTNGKGKVSDFTYDSLRTLKMKRAHNVATDSVRVPTLREALLCCKDRILVNVDHAYPYYKEIVELANELGVTGQVLMKGKSNIDKVNEDMSKYEHNLLYMPIIDINKPKGKALFAEYQERGVVPMAYEVCYSVLDEDAKECMKKIHETGSVLWINTFWPSVCGGYGNDDDAAYDAPDPFAVYQQYIDLGARMLQTDRPQLVIDFLRSKGLHD